MSTGKVVAGLVGVVVVLGGGLVAGDRYAEGRAEDYARGVVADSIPLTGTPEVDIRGFPFLTQVLRGTLDEVSAFVGSATLQGVSLRDVRVDAHDIQVRGAGGQPPRAGSVTVDATIPTSSIEQVIRERTGLTVQLAVSGATLRATGDVLSLPLDLGLTPRVSGAQIVVDVQDLKLGGRTISPHDLPSDLRSRVERIVLPVEGLPFGLALTGASVVAGGVRVTAAGSDVPLER